MPLHPGKYAEMLGKKMEKHHVNVWLINTGWTGGPYGTGNRMKLSYTRCMITAALEGKLDHQSMVRDEVFQLQVPTHIDGVPDELLIPRNTWQDKNAYDEKAKFLAMLFKKNFEKYAAGVDEKTLKAGPQI